MNKTLRNIIAVLLLAMLFISCNADLDKYGIFESMMNSAPNTDYTIQKFSGELDGKFLIETNDGIELLSTDGSKTTFIPGLHATIRFVTNDYVVYSMVEEGKTEANLYYIAKDSSGFALKNAKPATLKFEGKTLTAEASFYEEDTDDGNRYILLLTDGKEYYIGKIKVAVEAEDLVSFDKGTFTLETVVKTTIPAPVSGASDPSSPRYIGSGYYYVRYNEGYYLYTFDGQQVDSGNKFTNIPMAVENGILFLGGASGNLKNISGTTVTDLATTKDHENHKLGYQQLNQDVAMTKFNDYVYGFYGSKPFSVVAGTGYTEFESIGSGINIIDVTHKDGFVYAFSANNGLYKSQNGKAFDRVGK